MPHEQLLDLAQLRAGQLKILELIVVPARRPQLVVEPSQVLALYAAGTFSVGQVQEAAELLVAMPTMGLSDHLAGSHLEDSDQGGRAVSDHAQSLKKVQ